jgi:anti-sigma B factor antagonist
MSTTEIDPADRLELPPDVFADVIAEEEVAVIVLDGDVDLANTSEIEKGVDEVLASTTVGTLVLDLGGVDFMDSTGLRMLWEVRQKAQDARSRLVLRAPSDAVMRLLRLTGMHRIFAIEAPD